MIEDNFENRKKWDFTTRKVDVRDEWVVIEEMTADGWQFNGKDYNHQLNANPAVLLHFCRKKSDNQQKLGE